MGPELDVKLFSTHRLNNTHAEITAGNAKMKVKLELMHEKIDRVSKQAIVTMHNKKLGVGMPEIPTSL